MQAAERLNVREGAASGAATRRWLVDAARSQVAVPVGRDLRWHGSLAGEGASQRASLTLVRPGAIQPADVGRLLPAAVGREGPFVGGRTIDAQEASIRCAA